MLPANRGGVDHLGAARRPPHPTDRVDRIHPTDRADHDRFDLDEVRKVGETLRPHLADLRIAVAQEWITARAGSEKVFEALAALLPDAELFALSKDPSTSIETDGRPVTTTALDRSFLRRRPALALPLMPAGWWAMRRGRTFDLTITSSHAFARCFAPRGSGRHLSYVHSPARYLWFPEVDHRSTATVRAVTGPARAALRRLDHATARAERTQALAANSTTTERRIGEVYRRRAEVIFPPVATGYFGHRPDPDPDPPRTHLLAVSRFVPYKRIDDAIRVAAALDHPIVVAGSGPQEDDLRRLASTLEAAVEFRIRPTDDELRGLYRSATALVFPAWEDFGIVPVEAQAAGCPVVTCGRGGATDTVIDGETGAHAASPALVDLIAATRRLLAAGADPDRCRHNATRFSYRAFAERTAAWILAEGTA